MIHQLLRLSENLRADRGRPPLERLDALVDAERFVWTILPYVARSFSFCIAVLPRRTARPLAVAYLYCRMLDTYEDLPANVSDKEAALAAFVGRFAAFEQSGGRDPIEAAPSIGNANAQDELDGAYLLLLRHADRVDRFFATLPEAQRAAILRLVRRMGSGMIWAVRTFAAQGGELQSDEQMSRYCFEVLGNPMLFAEELQRIDCGLTPEVEPARVALAATVGESVQLANVARDLEKDCANGVFYLPQLKAADGASRAVAIAAARRRLLVRAVECGRAFLPFMSGVPSPRVSLARGAALLMALFALSFWQGIAERLGFSIDERGDPITKTNSIGLVVRGVFSRVGFDAVLAHLDLRFADAQARLALRDR